MSKKTYTVINQRFYQRVINFASSKKGEKILVLWSFLEASIWFIAPDLLLIIFAVAKPNSRHRFFLLALLASIFGGVVYYFINLMSFEATAKILSHTMFVKETSFAVVRDLYMTEGVMSVFQQPYSAIPYKVWTHLSVEAGLNPFTYFPLMLLARGFRFYLVVIVSSLLGVIFKKSIQNHFILVCLGIVIGFMTLVI